MSLVCGTLRSSYEKRNRPPGLSAPEFSVCCTCLGIAECALRGSHLPGFSSPVWLTTLRFLDSTVPPPPHCSPRATLVVTWFWAAVLGLHPAGSRLSQSKHLSHVHRTFSPRVQFQNCEACWREGSAAKGTYCFSRQSQFSSQHPHRGLRATCNSRSHVLFRRPRVLYTHSTHIHACRYSLGTIKTKIINIFKL